MAALPTRNSTAIAISQVGHSKNYPLDGLQKFISGPIILLKSEGFFAKINLVMLNFHCSDAPKEYFECNTGLAISFKEQLTRRSQYIRLVLIQLPKLYHETKVWPFFWTSQCLLDMQEQIFCVIKLRVCSNFQFHWLRLKDYVINKIIITQQTSGL